MKHLSVLAVAILVGCAGTAQGAEILLTGFQSAGFSQTINGAIFTNINPQTTGTGFVDPFIKFTDNGTTEQAFNFDSKNLPFNTGNDAYGSANWNRLLPAANLAVDQIDGVNYWTFILDIDQAPGANPYYSLDQLVLSWSTDPALNPVMPSYPALPPLGTVFYNMDLGSTNCGGGGSQPACGDVALGLNYLLNPGSGAGDLQVLIPVPDVPDGAYIYLYHAGGFYPDAAYINNDGPDEWWAKEGTTTVPDGGMTAAMLGMGLLALRFVARRKR
jgi:hypothetical protein